MCLNIKFQLNWKYFNERNFWPWKTKNLIQWNTFLKETVSGTINSFLFLLRNAEEVICKNRKWKLKPIVKTNVKKKLGLR